MNTDGTARVAGSPEAAGTHSFGGSGTVGAGGAHAGAGGSATAGTGSATGGAGGMGSTDWGKSAALGKAPTIVSSHYNNGHHISVTAGGMQREFILNVPTDYDNSKPYKFVIAYHELNGNHDEMYNSEYYHLLPLSNNTTIFVAPNGQENNKSCTAHVCTNLMGCSMGYPLANSEGPPPT